MVKWGLLALMILVLAVIIGGYVFLSASKPDYQGEMSLPGLESQVSIHFDDFGVPHIYAENERDLYYALGYVHAQDRLFQMELLRRVGAGRLSEILGPDLIETDRFLRTIGINEIAEHSAKVYLNEDNEPFQIAALAYLEGINSFIDNGATPPEFTLLGIPKEDFTPADLFRAVGYIGFNFNTAMRTDPLLTTIASKLGPDYLNDLVINTIKENTTIPTYMVDSSSIHHITETSLSVLNKLPVPEWMGSNSWVVGPSKSKSGYPLFANDAHIGFSQPSVWYEAHLNSPGFNFYGNHLAGFPFALIGHNDFSAWGLTIFPNDDMDFYKEKTDPENSQQVWAIDHWDPISSRKEVISVKNGEDIEIEVRSTRHGPIINEVSPVIDSLEIEPVSFSWTFTKFPCKALQTAYGMAHSRSMREFKQAISQLEAPGLNITYADKDGNIAWWAVARLIKRPPLVEPKMILDGSSGNDDPIGYYPFESNPHAENPPEGFVYSANNQPDSAFGILHPGYYYPGLRGQRIMDLLSGKDNWDLQSFKEMVLDDTSPLFPDIGQLIVQNLTGELNDQEQEVADILDQWDGSHGSKEIAPSVYYKLTNQLQKNTLQDELGAGNYKIYTTTLVARRTLSNLILNDSSLWWDDINSLEIEDRNQIINKSFRETVAALSEQLGPDPKSWYWERMHSVEHVHAIGQRKPFNHLFNVGPFPIAGGDEVINKMDFDKTSSPYKVRSGASMRILIDLADMQNSLSVIPTGQSGHPLSPHYQDQATLFHEGKFRPQLMNRKMILSNARHTLTLNPTSLTD